MPRYATVIRTTDEALLERIVASGLDWLMLDGEHASVGLTEMAAMLTIIGERLPCYARVRTLDGAQINHALDAGAAGVIIPNVDTPAQAEDAVRWVRTSRCPRAKVVVQAESGLAVSNIEAIVRTPGIEWVLIGPHDLTRSLGIPERFEDPAYRRAVATIESACREAGVPVGIFGMTPELLAPFEASGFTWLVTGINRTRLPAPDDGASK